MKHTPKPRKTVSKRPLGFLKGEIWMAPDFNASLEFVESSELLALRTESSKTAKKTIKKNRSEMRSSSKRNA